MRWLGIGMRLFSFLYHTLLALFLLGISGMAIANGTHTLQVEILPWWQGKTLSYCLLAAALIGILTLALAVKRVAPVLYLAWSMVVLLALIYGYFLTSFRFSEGGLRTAGWLILGALLAAAGGWLQCRSKPSKA